MEHSKNVLEKPALGEEIHYTRQVLYFDTIESIKDHYQIFWSPNTLPLHTNQKPMKREDGLPVMTA